MTRSVRVGPFFFFFNIYNIILGVWGRGIGSTSGMGRTCNFISKFSDTELQAPSSHWFELIGFVDADCLALLGSEIQSKVHKTIW